MEDSSSDEVTPDPAPKGPNEDPEESHQGPEETSNDRPIYCNQCGWKNPGGARYCSQCGSELQDLSTAEVPAGTRTVQADLPTAPDGADSGEASSSAAADASAGRETPLGQQVTLVVGAAVLLVVGLFFVTRWSQSNGMSGEKKEPGSPTPAAPRQGGSTPSAQRGTDPPREGEPRTSSAMDLRALVDSLGRRLSGPLATQVDSLRRVVRNADKTQKQQVRAELVNLLIGAGAPGRAALVQSRRADATGAVEDRRRAADLLYKWMRQLQGQSDRRQVLRVARHVAQAYQAVAKQRPQDLDARTRMGEAYLLTNNPMRGIQAINAVLEEDSTFVPARFQKGLALLQINRLNQALQQFRRVKKYTDPNQPFHQQAQRAIDVISKQLNKPESAEGSPSSTS